MSTYTPPTGGAVNFDLQTYTPPAGGAVNFALLGVAATPLTLTGAALDLESPYAVDDAVATAAAADGTPPYSYAITAQASSVTVLKVTGTLDPDATGYYVENGTYEGEPAYERVDGAYWIWWDGSIEWMLSEGKNEISPDWYTAEGPTGTYSAGNNTTGTATVANATPFQINASTGAITIADPGGLAVGHVWTITVQVTDALSATASDNWVVTLVSGVVTVSAAYPESTKLADQFAATLHALASATEGAALDDQYTVDAALRPSATEAAALSDAYAARIVGRVAITEGLVCGDAVAARAGLQASIVEGIAVNDTVTVHAALQAFITEGLAAGDAVTVRADLQASITEALAAGATASVRATLQSSITEALAVDDTFTVRATIQASITEGLAAGDTPDTLAVLQAALAEAVKAGEQWAVRLQALAQTVDGITLDDQYVADVIAEFLVAVKEGTVLGEQFAAALLGHAAVTESLRTGDAYETMLIATREIAERMLLGSLFMAIRRMSGEYAEAVVMGDVFTATIAMPKRGPYKVAAAQLWSPGAAAAATWQPGAAAGKIWSPSSVAGQIV